MDLLRMPYFNTQILVNIIWKKLTNWVKLFAICLQYYYFQHQCFSEKCIDQPKTYEICKSIVEIPEIPKILLGNAS